MNLKVFYLLVDVVPPKTSSRLPMLPSRGEKKESLDKHLVVSSIFVTPMSDLSALFEIYDYKLETMSWSMF